MDHIKLTPEVLSVGEASTLATHSSCGAISLFLGTTRDMFEGKEVLQLEYEAYNEMAEKEMQNLCKQARKQWNLKHIVLHHRLGLVPVSETSVIIAVSSEHRRESLDAVSFLIDELKARVPIWKKEVYSDGSGDWKKNKECTWLKTKASTEEAQGVDDTLNNNKRAMTDDGKMEDNLPVKKIKEEFNPDLVTSEDHTSGVFEGPSVLSSEHNDIPEEKPSLISHSVRHEIDPNYVQIVASKKELFRRIAAFQKRKREELDVLNVQEFCTLNGSEPSMNSCARTSAVVLRSKDSHSHLKLTRVVNDWGPQTVGMDPSSLPIRIADTKGEGGSSKRDSREVSVESKVISNDQYGQSSMKKDPDLHPSPGLPEGIEERLGNMERHLRILPKGPVPRDVYVRIKALEDKILYLEGMSPEYLHGQNKMCKSSKINEVKAVEDDISLDELDMKIYELKMKLKQKQLKQVF